MSRPISYAPVNPVTSDPGPQTKDPEAGKKALRATFATSFEDAQSRADAAWRTGDADTAVYLYVQALSFQPRDVPTLAKLGAIEESRGNLDLAARAFELAANSAPADARVTASFGLLQLQRHEYASAVTWLRRSVEDGSTDGHVYDGLSVASAHQGFTKEAVTYSTEAVRINPASPQVQLHRAEALLAIGRVDEANVAARQALNLEQSPQAWRLLAQVQARQHDYAQAIDSLLQADDPPQAFNLAGKWALANGDNSVALRYFDKAAAASPVYMVDAQRNAALARERLEAKPQ